MTTLIVAGIPLVIYLQFTANKRTSGNCSVWSYVFKPMFFLFEKVILPAANLQVNVIFPFSGFGFDFPFFSIGKNVKTNDNDQYSIQ